MKKLHLSPSTLPSLLLLTLLVLTTSCGFHLRGQDGTMLPASFNPIYISGLSDRGDFQRSFRQAFKSSGADLVDDRAAAATIITILDQKSTRRVLTVDSRNKVAEYELEESLRFSVRSASGTDIIPSGQVTVLRIHLNPEDLLLGQNREEELLRGDMRRDLVSQLINRLRSHK